MTESIEKREATVYKTVRTKDGLELGNVIGVNANVENLGE